MMPNKRGKQVEIISLQEDGKIHMKSLTPLYRLSSNTQQLNYKDFMRGWSGIKQELTYLDTTYCVYGDKGQ